MGTPLPMPVQDCDTCLHFLFCVSAGVNEKCRRLGQSLHGAGTAHASMTQGLHDTGRATQGLHDTGLA